MASSKEKLLNSAQKSLKKKQLAKAIKDFAKVVDLDPGDVRSRQKLAELYVRTNRPADAYEHYEAVAKYFSSNGFYLKAIAIYKQMQRLDPGQIALYNRLAELNEKQGLVGNAMAEYRNLVNYYERNDMTADAIKTLEKMRDLDAKNLNVRVKLAEVYAVNKREVEGLAEFEGVLNALSGKKEFDKILKLYKMFLPLYPHNHKLQMGLALTLFEKGELEKGLGILANLLREKPNNPDILRLMARGYDDLKDWENSEQTYRLLLDLDPTDLDNRESLIACLFSQQQYDSALSELEDWKDSFFKADRLEQLKSRYESLKQQLPGNSVVKQTLDSIYELTGDGEKLLDIMSETDDEPVEPAIVEETLSDSLLGSAVEDIESSLLGSSSEEESGDGFVFEPPVEENSFDLELEPFSEQDVSADPETEEEIFELDLSENSDPLAEASDDLEFSFDLQDDQEAASAQIETEVPTRDVQAGLEEAEFYIQQGLYSEAEKLCQDILSYAPDSIECQQKLEEIKSHLATDQDLAASGLHDLASEVLTDGFPGLDEEPGDEGVAEPFDEMSSAQKVFRTDVDEQIAADDLESHYNLGIAYREMGLLDDAIGEFSKAERDPARFVDCQTLKGLCYSDKEDFAQSELMLQQALDSQHLDDSQRINLCYELGSVYERAERLDEALSSYQLVLGQDEDYRDAKEKVRNLSHRLGKSVADSLSAEESKERISFL